LKTQNRSEYYQRVDEVELILNKLQSVLQPVELEEINSHKDIKYPIYLIMGCARSGTTALMQYLTRTLDCFYPTNLLSRFYYAPYLGSLYQKLFFDLDFKGELFNIDHSEDQFKSLLGKTTGADSPNEFWYFWRRFFRFNDIQKLSASDLLSLNTTELLNEFSAMQSVYKKPFLFKGMNLNWHIDYMSELHETFRFVHIHRNVVLNAYSLYCARYKFYNNYNTWYSFKPPEYNKLKHMSPIEQVVGQVIYTNKVISDQLKNIDINRKVIISYESFCESPYSILENFDMEKSELGLEMKINKASDYSIVPPYLLSQILRAVELFKNL